MSNENMADLSQQLSDLIRKEVDYALNSETKIQSAIVDYVSKDGTLAIHFPPNKTIYTGIINQSIYEFETGASVKVLKEKNSTSNMWVIGSFNDFESHCQKKFVSFDELIKQLETTSINFNSGELSEFNVFDEEYIDMNNILENFAKKYESYADTDESYYANFYQDILDKIDKLKSQIEDINLSGGSDGDIDLQNEEFIINLSNAIFSSDQASTIFKNEILSDNNIIFLTNEIINNVAQGDYDLNQSFKDYIAEQIISQISTKEFEDARNIILDRLQIITNNQFESYSRSDEFTNLVQGTAEIGVSDRIDSIFELKEYNSIIENKMNNFLSGLLESSNVEIIYEKIASEILSKNEEYDFLVSSIASTVESSVSDQIQGVITDLVTNYGNMNADYTMVAQSIADWIIGQSEYSTALSVIKENCLGALTNEIENSMNTLVERYRINFFTQVEKMIDDEELAIGQLKDAMASYIINKDHDEYLRIKNYVLATLGDEVELKLQETLRNMDLMNLNATDQEKYGDIFSSVARAMAPMIIDNLDNEGFFDLSNYQGFTHLLFNKFVKSEDYLNFVNMAFNTMSPQIITAFTNEIVEEGILTDAMQGAVLERLVSTDQWGKFLNILTNKLSENDELINDTTRTRIVEYLTGEQYIDEFLSKITGKIGSNIFFSDFGPTTKLKIENAIYNYIIDKQAQGENVLALNSIDKINISRAIGEKYVENNLYTPTVEDLSNITDALINTLIKDGKINDNVKNDLLTGIINEFAKQKINDLYGYVVSDNSLLEKLFENSKIAIKFNSLSQTTQNALISLIGSTFEWSYESNDRYNFVIGIGSSYYEDNKENIKSMIDEQINSEELTNIISEFIIKNNSDLLKNVSSSISYYIQNDADKNNNIISYVKTYLTGLGYPSLVELLSDKLAGRFTARDLSENAQILIANEISKQYNINNETFFSDVNGMIGKYYFENNKNQIIETINSNLEFETILSSTIESIFSDETDKNMLLQGISSEIGQQIIEDPNIMANINNYITGDGFYDIVGQITHDFELGPNEISAIAHEIAINDQVIREVISTDNMSYLINKIAYNVTNEENYITSDIASQVAMLFITYDENGVSYIDKLINRDYFNLEVGGAIADSILRYNANENETYGDLIYQKISKSDNFNTLVTEFFQSSYLAEFMSRNLWSAYSGGPNYEKWGDYFIKQLINTEDTLTLFLEELIRKYGTSLALGIARSSDTQQAIIDSLIFTDSNKNQYTDFIQQIRSEFENRDVQMDIIDQMLWTYDDVEQTTLRQSLYNKLNNEINDNISQYAENLSLYVSNQIYGSNNLISGGEKTWTAAKQYNYFNPYTIFRYENNSWSIKEYNDEKYELSIQGYDTQLYDIPDTEPSITGGVFDPSSFVNYNGDSKWGEYIDEEQREYYVCNFSIHLPMILPIEFQKKITIDSLLMGERYNTSRYFNETELQQIFIQSGAIISKNYIVNDSYHITGYVMPLQIYIPKSLISLGNYVDFSELIGSVSLRLNIIIRGGM